MAIPALLGAAIASGVSGLGSSLLSFFGNRETNRANKAIAADTNQANLQLYNMQVENQLEQWNRENAYNTPTMQSARLRAAGLNPALMNGSNPTGVASAASSSMPTAQPVQGYQYSSPLNAFSDLPNNLVLASETFKNFQEGENTRLGNQYVNQEHIKNLALLDAQIDEQLTKVKQGSEQWKILMWQKRQIALDYKLNAETFDVRKQGFQLQNDLVEAQAAELQQRKELNAAQAALANANKLLTDEQRKMIPKDFELRMQEAISRIMLAASQRELNINQAAYMFFSAVGQDLSNKNSAWDYVTKQILWPETKRQFEQNGLINDEGLIDAGVNRTLNIYGGIKNPIEDVFKQLGAFVVGRGAKAFAPTTGKGITYGTNASYTR